MTDNKANSILINDQENGKSSLLPQTLATDLKYAQKNHISIKSIYEKLALSQFCHLSSDNINHV